MAGAYKQKRGASDIVIEPYDWNMDAVLLPAEEIEALQNEATRISARYANHEGNPISTPLVEGTIGALPVESLAVQGDSPTMAQIKEFVEDIEGWLTPAEGWALFELARDCQDRGVITEIGSWKGKSTIWLGHGSKQGRNIQIYAIDPHTGSVQTKELIGEQYTYPEFMANIKRAGIEDIVTPLVMTSEEAAKDFRKPVGLVFIDGDHAYEMVKLDFELWFPKLVIGGVMAFHDACAGWPGPERVVQEYIRNSAHFNKVTTVGSLVFATKVLD